VLDMGAGMWLSIGILSALFKRTQSGIGSSVATSLFETGVSWSSYHLLAHQISGATSTRSGTGHPAFAPYGLFPTSDGEVMIGVGGDAVFERLVCAIERSDLTKDPRFDTNMGRVTHQDQLRELISESFIKFSTVDLIATLRSADVPADRLQLPEDLLKDPAAASQLTQVVVDGHDAVMPALPLRINGQYPPIKFPS
jgi:crotonobetainyl-CoA:carnitine CoA-transferase CaiB-like acyl-CoA transferase